MSCRPQSQQISFGLTVFFFFHMYTHPKRIDDVGLEVSFWGLGGNLLSGEGACLCAGLIPRDMSERVPPTGSGLHTSEWRRQSHMHGWPFLGGGGRKHEKENGPVKSKLQDLWCFFKSMGPDIKMVSWIWLDPPPVFAFRHVQYQSAPVRY